MIRATAMVCVEEWLCCIFGGFVFWGTTQQTGRDPLGIFTRATGRDGACVIMAFVPFHWWSAALEGYVETTFQGKGSAVAVHHHVSFYLL